MLKPISRLRSRCKGDLNYHTNLSNRKHIRNRQNNYSYKYSITKVSKRVLQYIPVLSIFVLLGIMGYAIISPNSLANLLSNVDGEVYAADTTSNTSSLIIDNGTATDSTSTVRGGVTYSSHTVQVKAENITGYTLSITGPTNLSNGTTTIGGAGGKTGTQLASADTGWGYGWGDKDAADANMTYNSFTGSAQTLSGDSVSSNSINFTRKLVFAAKFNQNSTEGHYRANVKLNLAVTPKALTADFSVKYNMNGGTGGPTDMSLATNDATFTSYTYTIPDVSPVKSGYIFKGWNTDNGSTVKYRPADGLTLTTANPSVTLYAVWIRATWSDITDMQDMTPAICKSATIGASKTLTDIRDNKAYTVQRLTDGNCWMTSNMALDLGTTTLSPSDSNVTTTYTKITATTVTVATNWTSDELVVQWTPQLTVDSSYKGDGNGYQSAYGYYYSYCAATAGTCSDSSVNGRDAQSSICPKNWFLPKGGVTIAPNTSSSQTGNDFINLMNADGANITSITASVFNNYGKSWSDKVVASPPARFTLGGAPWYIAGVVNRDGIVYPGQFAAYWSRTEAGVWSYIKNTYSLQFNNGTLYPAYLSQGYVSDGSWWAHGASVRCIAYSS